ncbi:restriction endonuclease [Limosilactobacillus reuteri]|uniref:restriction endonuclease n=1 Tax=Limosilactobacillus reuteri TaxID=1598 RepID=UPI002E7AEEAC|nr:restriction endonuclease [Limosilactobacillus reuteri]MEE1989387.1 restriction endonuclease [Limosilactobacillus reuteri]
MANRQIEIENKAMKEILIAMHNLGGQVTRKQVLQELRDGSDVFSEKEIDATRTSKKSGKIYHPFQWKFNFAVKHLILAGFIDTENGHDLELSKKGRNVDINRFDANKDVRSISEAKMPHHKARNKAKKASFNVLDNDQANSDEVDEPWRQQLLEALIKMNPKKFELFCRGLLTKMGIDVDDKIGIQYVADGGVDGFGYVRSDDYRTTRVALQAKRWKGKVSAPEIDKFRGAMDKFNAEFGIFITNSDFTREAVRTAREGTRIITLINGDQICDLVAKYNYYVEPVTTYRLKDFYLDQD